MIFNKLTLFFLLRFLNSYPAPIKMNAVYSQKNGQLIPTFGVHYGFETSMMIRVEFNIKTDIILLFENMNFEMEGVECKQEYGCLETKTIDYVKHPDTGKDLLTKQSIIALKLSAGFENSVNLKQMAQFNLYKSPFPKINHIIGLSPSSKFWSFISQKYDAQVFSLKCDVSLQTKWAREVYRDIEKIKTSIVVFGNSETIAGHRQEVESKISFNNVRLIIGDLSLLREPTFSWSHPFVFRVNHIDYQKVLLKVKQEICPNPKQCENESDLFGSFVGNSWLQFVFPIIEDINQKKPFVVKFPVGGLFAIDEKQKIDFNFACFDCEDISSNPVSSRLEFGLMFLEKVDLSLTYNDFSRKLFLSIALKDDVINKKIKNIYLLCSIAISVLIVVTLRCFLKPMSSWVEQKSRVSLLFEAE